MRVAVIGLGRAGVMHLDAWAATDGVAVAAVVDPAPGARRAARARGIPAYAGLEELFARQRVDAVSVCTPPALHGPVVTACLAHGLHVLCEKPLALSTREALGMLRAAARSRRHLVLATKFRHVGDVVRARELIQAGAIGDPVTFDVHFASRVDMLGRWNAEPATSGGGVVCDNGCHAFDIVSFLFGTVTRVLATALRPLQALQVEDSASVLVEAAERVVGRIDLSWSLDTRRETYVTVHGASGTIEVGWRGSRLRCGDGPARPIGRGYDRDGAHRRMVAAFRDQVTGRGRPWISAPECLRTVAAVEAAYRSLRTGAWAPVVARVRDRQRLQATA